MDVKNTSMNAFALANSIKRYGMDRWGRDFVSVNTEGHLTFRAPGCNEVDLQALAELLDRRGISSPFVVRFPTMIEAQMRRLHDAFESAGHDNGFSGGHIGVYPLKVNQRRSVVETVTRAREKVGYGLEAGSKPELLLAMSQEPLTKSILVCNGYKDREFIKMAFHAAELGHRVVIVLESVAELGRFLEVLKEEQWSATPELGMRAKLYSKGSGRWQSSGGEQSKFGLTTTEILEVVRSLRDVNGLHHLTLLHFHIGSQITQIKRVKTAVREGMRIWGYLKQMAPTMRYLDLGGGIGVDYDGSHTSHQSSANYTLQEYANQVVFEVVEVADEMGVEHPTILTESGRVLVASHAVTIADLREVQGELLSMPAASDDEHRLITELRYTLENLNVKNMEEYYHDAVDYRDEALQLFSRGYLSLEDRASAEGLFARLRLKTERMIETMPRQPEEILRDLRNPQHKYLVNFSIFQSVPDSWSIDQVFPAAPLSRHEEMPNIKAQLVDITCDSDGCVEKFAHPEDDMNYLALHRQDEGAEGRYYLGIFMTGAYQDSLASMHNLFSRCHEVVVRAADDDSVIVGSERFELDEETHVEIKSGLTNEDVLALMDHDVATMAKLLRDRHLDRETTLGQPWAMGLLQGYPYLSK
jgi:arginine decarboxylase